MESYSRVLSETEEEIVSVRELKLLLNSILEHHANIRLKYLFDGELWPGHFLRVLMVTEKGVILNDEMTNKITSIKFLSDITQFELEKPYESYLAKSRYKVSA